MKFALGGTWVYDPAIVDRSFTLAAGLKHGLGGAWTFGDEPTDISFALAAGLKHGLGGAWTWESGPTDQTFALAAGLKHGLGGAWSFDDAAFDASFSLAAGLKYGLGGAWSFTAGFAPPSWSRPTFLATALDTPITISTGAGNVVSVTSADTSIDVVLTVSHGTLTLSGTTGLTFTGGDGTADATMSFSGSPFSVNVALDGMVYTPTTSYQGVDSLALNVADSLAQSDFQTVDIEVFRHSSLAFSGSGQDVKVSYATGLQLGGTYLSVACWVKLTDLGAHHCLMAARDGGAAENWQLYVLSNGHILFTYAHGGTDEVIEVTGHDVSTGVWHHIAASLDGSNVIIFLDGAAVSTVAQVSTVDATHHPVYLGWDSTTNRLKGKLADCRLFGRGLDSGEVGIIMAHFYCNTSAGIVGHWRLDDNTGTAPADSSGNAFTGAFEGSPTWDSDSPAP